MAFIVEPLVSTTAESILVWCGVADPTPTETSLAGLAAKAAEDAIRHYRRLDIAPTWRAEYSVSLGVVRQPTVPNGHLYKATTAGITGEIEPIWPTEPDSTVIDGTVLWTEYVRPLEKEYESLAVEIGVYLYNKRGVDGVVSFSENGVAQSFEAGSIPKSMLSRITIPAQTG